ncbi:unnamed protein product, partial [Prorocentrum cordatum]
MRYFEFWTSDIWPAIKDDYERLLLERPAKQEEATGTHYGKKVFECLATKGEVRNVSCNLCWTNPSANSALQQDIALELVENFAADMYLVATAHDASQSTSAGAGGIGNDATEGAAAIASAATVRDMALKDQRTWKVPARELIMEASLNFPLETERLRDHFGMDGKNLMMVCAKVRELLQDKKIGKSLPSAEEVHQWMTSGGRVNWGMFRVPSVKVVSTLLKCAEVLSKNSEACCIVDRARAHFGRDNLFDWPTKILTLVRQCDTHSGLAFACRWLFAHMLRTKQKNPFSDSQLDGKGGIVAQCLWIGRYAVHLQKTFPDALRKPIDDLAPTEAADGTAAVAAAGARPPPSAWDTARACLGDPMAMHELLEGPNRRRTWLQALPRETTRMLMSHALDVFSGLYAPEIKGALSAITAGKYTAEKFWEADRVKKRFHAEFIVAYKKAAPKTVSSDMADPEAPPSATSAGSAEAAVKHAEGTAPDAQAAFKAQIEAHCQREMEARMVILTSDGRHDELCASVVSTELHANLESGDGRFVAVYDPKNAKLCNIFEGECLTQREPPVDEGDFKRFCDVTDNVMKRNQDICWVFGGRVDTNEAKIKKVFKEKGWKVKEFILVYESRLMERYYWTVCRGVANSKTTEKLFLCWKGKMPPKIPQERWYVDRGSRMYVEVMSKVPVCAPKDLTFVSKDVRDVSLRSMMAPPDESASAADAAADGALGERNAEGPTQKKIAIHARKRRLYRHLTGTEEVWFPFDFHGAVIKELIWEAGGSDAVKWVLFGTPASGNGVLGALEMGCSVIALTADEHHKTHFLKTTREKAVESALTGQASAFCNRALYLQAQALRIVKDGRDGAEDEGKDKGA